MSRELHASAAVHVFAPRRKVVRVAPYGSGHINDTFLAHMDSAPHEDHLPRRIVVQRINHAIFKQPDKLMENMQRVTAHLAAHMAREPDADRRSLRLIPTHEGRILHLDEHGNYWRAMHFVERAQGFDEIQSSALAFEAAKAFGRFQQILSTLGEPRLHDTIPDFHHTPRRFEALEAAIQADAVGRVKDVGPEIDFALRHKPIASALLDLGLPERVTHNDTKLNNVLFDERTGEGVCVIDLDTVMPGLAPYDFGDMVRTATCAAAEDERDLSKIGMDFAMFEALTRGYLASAGGFLTSEERRSLPLSGKLITFEIGIRFLTDYLNGDAYFKIHRPGHNLDRCRTQFKLVESIEAQEPRMDRLVKELGA